MRRGPSVVSEPDDEAERHDEVTKMDDTNTDTDTEAYDRRSDTNDGPADDPSTDDAERRRTPSARSRNRNRR